MFEASPANIGPYRPGVLEDDASAVVLRQIRVGTWSERGPLASQARCTHRCTSYDEMRPGCFNVDERFAT